MKKFCFILIMLAQTLVMYAIPADSRLFPVVQKDGSILLVRLCGDEFYHYYVTEDGYPILEDSEGGWFYVASYEEKFILSTVLAHNTVDRNEEESRFLTLREENGEAQSLRNCVLQQRYFSQVLTNDRRLRSAPHRVVGEPTQYLGKKRGLVLLVNFANATMSETDPRAFYDDMFNKSGYSMNGHIGSVHDYFYDQSYGKLDLSFDVVGPLTVSKNYGYYGSEGTLTSHGSDKYVDEMVREACIMADQHVDFKNYDWNGDGEVDQVYIIYAGYGQATGGYANTIWPHEYELQYFPKGKLELDGIIINKYACSNELYGNSGSTHMGMGVACHEFSHCLGLPDTYDTDYSGGYGMGFYDVMCSGSYNGPKGIGEVPCGFSAFERWFAGWLDFTDITTSQKAIFLSNLESLPQAYRVFNGGNSNEYYTFENRQATKWFKYVDTNTDIHGMLVTHIDYDSKTWQSNDVNQDPRHQRMGIIPADGSLGNSIKDIKGDLYPGIMSVSELTNTSHSGCGGYLFNPNKDGSYDMNVSILEIKEADQEISFDVVFNEELPVPTVYQPIAVDGQYILKWEDIIDADSYTIQIKSYLEGNPIRVRVVEETIDMPEYSFSAEGVMLIQYKLRANKGQLHSEWSELSTINGSTNGIVLSSINERTKNSYHSITGRARNTIQGVGIFINDENRRKQFIKQ